MAYPIEHHRDGFYIFINMLLTPEFVFELDRTPKVTEGILRHMMSIGDPKAVQKEREEREEREARVAAQAATAAQAEVPAGVAVASAEEVPINSEDEVANAISPEEIEYVPPAIEEEETIEA